MLLLGFWKRSVALAMMAGVSVLASPSADDVYAWFAGDIDLRVASDSYSVAVWGNQGRHGTNSTSSQASRNLVNLTGQPQKIYLRRSGGEAAGAVRFSGADGIWAAKSAFGILSGSRTIMVCARVMNASSQGFLFDSTSTTPGYTRALVSQGLWRVSTTSETGEATGPATLNEWQVHSFVVSTNGQGARMQHFTNSTLSAEVTSPTAGALSGLMIGANVAQQFGIQGDVAEALVFDSALEPGARTDVESYLRSKWFSAVPDLDAPPRAEPVQFVPVFVGGEAGYGCYRIPAMVCSKKGTLLAVADGRLSGCGDIPNPLDLVLRRSFDNGKTWGPLQIIANYGSDATDKDVYPSYGITNPVSRVAAGDAAMLVDRQTSRIWVLYDNGGVVSGARKIKLELRFSDDDGATWSGAIDLEGRNAGLRPTGGEFLAGPGNGVQLEGGAYAGRLIFPVYIYGAQSYSLVIYSDDHGETWRRGGVAGAGGGEIQVAETAGGGLLASMRDNNFATTGVRTFSRSTDGGVTWGPIYTSTPGQAALPDPASQGSLFRLTTTNDSNRSRMIFANAADSASRIKMTLRMSYDEGKTWPVSDLIWSGSSAYSSVCRTAGGEVGLLFERANYSRIDFVRRSVSEMTQGADKLPAYTAWAGELFTPAQLADAGITAPGADPDGDSFDNYAEFLAGTDPLDGKSALVLSILETQAGEPMLTFEARPNRPYSVESTADLGGAAWGRFAEISPRETNFAAEVVFSRSNASGFFRLATPGPSQ